MILAQAVIIGVCSSAGRNQLMPSPVGSPHFSYCRNYLLSVHREALNKQWAKLSARERRKHGNTIKAWYWPTLRAKWESMSRAKQLKTAALAAQHAAPQEKVAKVGLPKRKLASTASESIDSPLPARKIAKVASIFDNSPAENRLNVRADFIAAVQTADMIRTLLTKAHGIFVMFFLHGLYEPSVVLLCSMVMKELPINPARSRKVTTSVLERALAVAETWPGKKVFPYPWISDGVAIWKELMPHWPKIWNACLLLAALPKGASFAKVDEVMPLEVGSTYSALGYMRRHLGRNIHVFIDGRCQGPADWALCWDGMGEGPRGAVTILQCQSYTRATSLLAALGSRTHDPYTLHDLTCFLCLKLSALRKALA